ncbi:prepilin [Escherichia coli]|nr:prepilin [Salmonella enterica]EDB5794294.1 prepilin [Salmonella enterica subsp. enterica serovar Altona]EHQ5924390.1 prepilin [Escherichia coli]ULK73877.1 prepilin [Shigella flexneri]EHO8958513.1 prepilin [Salmonella enterica]
MLLPPDHRPDWHWPTCQSGTWRTIGGKLKVTQLSTTGYLGQFDFCAIARVGNAEDAHYCQVVESPAGSRKWYKYEHKTGCIASCVTLN